MSDFDKYRLRLVKELKRKINQKDILLSSTYKTELNEKMNSLKISELQGFIDGINYALNISYNENHNRKREKPIK